MNIYLYHNYETFVANKYDEESIQKVSKVTQLYFDPTEPKWIDFDFESFELSDETDFINLGESK